MDKKVIPGLILLSIISILSIYIEKLLPFTVESLTIAIIIGILYNNTIKTNKIFTEGIKFSLKKLLKLGIILLGFKLNILEIIKVGPKLLILVLIIVPLTLLVYMVLSKKFKVNKKLATLLGVGSCICGASAIVALTPVINADEDDSVISVSVISFLGAIAVVIYSMIGNLHLLTNTDYGIWSGLSLQGVAHAIAAAFALGDSSGEIGTVVKMVRVAMLVPVSLFLGSYFNKNQNSKTSSFPLYVLFFILATIINSLDIIPKEIVTYLKETSNFLILLAMTAMGLSVNFRSFAKKGIKPLIMASTLFIVFSIFNYFLVYLT